MPKNKIQRPKALLYIGDLHAGAKSAVACKFESADEDEPPLVPSKRQRELYLKLKELEGMCKVIALRHDLILCVGADCVDGYHHHGSNTWGTPDDQRQLAVRLLMPFANMATAIYGLLGTESHVGIEGNDDKAVVRELGGKSAQRFVFDHDGVLIDWTHHINCMKYPAQNVIMSVRDECVRTGDPLPSIIIRHHIHRYDHNERNILYGGELKRIQAAICPCWKLPDPFTRKVAPTTFPDIGALLVYPHEEKITPILFNYKKDTVTKL